MCAVVRGWSFARLQPDDMVSLIELLKSHTVASK